MITSMNSCAAGATLPAAPQPQAAPLQLSKQAAALRPSVGKMCTTCWRLLCLECRNRHRQRRQLRCRQHTPKTATRAKLLQPCRRVHSPRATRNLWTTSQHVHPALGLHLCCFSAQRSPGPGSQRPHLRQTEPQWHRQQQQQQRTRCSCHTVIPLPTSVLSLKVAHRQPGVRL